MADFSWIRGNFYAVILTGKEEKQLDNRANKNKAGSAYMATMIENGLALGERIEDKDTVKEDKNG